MLFTRKTILFASMFIIASIIYSSYGMEDYTMPNAIVMSDVTQKANDKKYMRNVIQQHEQDMRSNRDNLFKTICRNTILDAFSCNTYATHKRNIIPGSIKDQENVINIFMQIVDCLVKKSIQCADDYNHYVDLHMIEYQSRFEQIKQINFNDGFNEKFDKINKINILESECRILYNDLKNIDLDSVINTIYYRVYAMLNEIFFNVDSYGSISNSKLSQSHSDRYNNLFQQYSSSIKYVYQTLCTSFSIKDIVEKIFIVSTFHKTVLEYKASLDQFDDI